jgi:hypothetical protein
MVTEMLLVVIRAQVSLKKTETTTPATTVVAVVGRTGIMQTMESAARFGSLFCWARLHEGDAVPVVDAAVAIRALAVTSHAALCRQVHHC